MCVCLGRAPQTTVAVVLRNAIMAVVIHKQMNISAISHGAAVNSPDRAERGQDAAAELWKQFEGSSAACLPNTYMHIWMCTCPYVKHSLLRCL